MNQSRCTNCGETFTSSAAFEQHPCVTDLANLTLDELMDRRMTDKYKGCMPDHLFRTLSAREEKKFRKWARDNWSPTLPENFSVMHPVVRDEWRKLDEAKQS